jgi:hypothetical protein
MPISIPEFERGEAADPGESADSFEAKARKFLEASREKAFTLEEIAKGTGFDGSEGGRVDELHANRTRLYNALEHMAHEGRIRQNEVRVGKYFDQFWAAK